MRANEARVTASGFIDTNAKRELLKIADDYDQLAGMAERLEERFSVMGKYEGRDSGISH